MKEIDYLTPESLEDTLEILSIRGDEARIIAGGTDLIPQMRSGLLKPSLLIDPRLLSLDYINLDNNIIRIGACTTHTDILESGILVKYLRLLGETASEIAGPPVRNRGTIGGNLVNASPAADFAAPLLVYDAQLVLKRWGSARVVPVDGFFTQPGKTIMKSDEIITEICVPLLPHGTGTKFIKLGKRKAMAISVVSVAVSITKDNNGAISIARIALGSVAPTPIRVKSAEAFLLVNPPNDDVFAEAGEIAASESSPISDIRASDSYRKRMVSVLTKRALIDAWNRIRQGIDNE